MKRLILFFVLSFSGMMVLSAQNIEENAAVRDALDKMLERLDKTKVPTWLLLDYAFDLVDFTGMMVRLLRTAIMWRERRSSVFCEASGLLP